MHSFEYEGVAYRSLREFCRVKGVSYGKVQRLRRKYVKAWADVAQALRWALGTEPLNYAREPQSARWVKDSELSRIREGERKLRAGRRLLQGGRVK